MVNFEDPRCFVPQGLANYIDLQALGTDFPEHVLTKRPGTLKQVPEDFIVTEPVPKYPGRPDLHNAGPDAVMPPRYLTIGPESDMPGLKTDERLTVMWKGQRVPAVALTAVKDGENTWGMMDGLKNHLSNQLGRTISHENILTSGLKDRWAITAQTVVIVGVSMDDMKRVDWSRFQPGRRGFFVKDIRPADYLLGMGDHLANYFEINVRVPGMTREQLEEYMLPRAQWLGMTGYFIPNMFHRQRLGPNQSMQKKGLTALTGEYKPDDLCHPFNSNVEAWLHRLLFEVSPRDHAAVRELRTSLSGLWQYNFEEIERQLRRVHKRFNLSLEYEVASRLANLDVYGGCCEAVLYDLRDRLSICIGAWQAFRWNHEVAAGILSGRLKPGSSASVPLPMSTDDARNVYSRTAEGRQCIKELGATERLAASAERYLEAFIEWYWNSNPRNRKDHPDKCGLSLRLVKELFSCSRPLPSADYPGTSALSAALVKRLFLEPWDRFTGNKKNGAPRRRAYVQVSDFDYTVKGDGMVQLRFGLRSGSYATMLVGLLFDTADPDELELAAPATEASVA